jgi:hypothetical protein
MSDYGAPNSQLDNHEDQNINLKSHNPNPKPSQRNNHAVNVSQTQSQNVTKIINAMKQRKSNYRSIKEKITSVKELNPYQSGEEIKDDGEKPSPVQKDAKVLRSKDYHSSKKYNISKKLKSAELKSSVKKIGSLKDPLAIDGDELDNSIEEHETSSPVNKSGHRKIPSHYISPAKPLTTEYELRRKSVETDELREESKNYGRDPA